MAASAKRLDNQSPEHADFNRLRIYDDASTLFAESLEGNMRTSFEFRFDGHELYGHDGRALKPIFHDAISEADKIAQARPNLLFELRRRTTEFGEYQHMLAMARGEKHNTLVVISDFPPELMDVTADVGGYNVSRKQTMLRVITRQPNGTLKMITQSLDRSNRPALEAIYNRFDIKPAPGELLDQRIEVGLSQEKQDNLPDELRDRYDQSLTEQYGGHWYAGRRGEESRNTYNFVTEQHDLLKFFVASTLRDPAGAEKLRYNLAATFSKRFGFNLAAPLTYEVDPHVHERRLLDEMIQAGTEAIANGRSFSGCGLTMGAAAGQLKEAGYGNKTNETTVYKYDLKTYCRVCQKPPKKDEQPKMCGPCEVCKPCDIKLRSPMARQAA